MDAISEIIQLKAQLAEHKRIIRELLSRTGNLPARFAFPLASKQIQAYRITTVASGPRKKYRANKITYLKPGGDDPAIITTFSSDSGAAIDVYNVLEVGSPTATPLLVVGDEVQVWQQDGLSLCMEIPRGFHSG